MNNAKSIPEIICEFNKLNNNEEEIIPKDLLSDYIKESEKICMKLTKEYLSEQFELLDIGILTIVKIQRLVDTEKDIEFGFLAIFSKLVTQLLSMRILLLNGMMDAFKCIYRSFIESIDVLYASLGNKDFVNSFGKTDKMYDNNKFWNEKISKGKIDKLVSQLFQEIDISENYIQYFLDRKRDLKKFHSESVHSSLNSAFVTYSMPSIDWTIESNLFGNISTAYPYALLHLLEDINLINQIVNNCLNNKAKIGFLNIKFHGKLFSDYTYLSNLYLSIYSVKYPKFYEEHISIMEKYDDLKNFAEKTSNNGA